MRPLEELAPVVGQWVGPMPYPVINTLFDELLPKGLRHYWKSMFVAEIAEETLDLHVDHAARVPTLESGTFFFPIDGACHRVGADETAFAFRDARFGVGIFGTWPDPADDERNIAWVRDYDEALRPFSLGGGYVNFSSSDEQGPRARDLRRKPRSPRADEAPLRPRRTSSGSTRTSSPLTPRSSPRGKCDPQNGTRSESPAPVRRPHGWPPAGRHPTCVAIDTTFREAVSCRPRLELNARAFGLERDHRGEGGSSRATSQPCPRGGRR